jgi:hypothetical protein
VVLLQGIPAENNPRVRGLPTCVCKRPDVSEAAAVINASLGHYRCFCLDAPQLYPQLYYRAQELTRQKKTLLDSGIAKDLADSACREFQFLRVEELVDSRTARERMTNLGRTLVDGLGTTRVVEAAQQSEVQWW